MSDDTNQTRADGTAQGDGQEEKNGNGENQAYIKELEELEKARKEHEERKKEEIERMRREHEKKKDEKEGGGEDQEKEKMIPRHTLDKPKKVFSTEKKIFRHNRINDFSGSGVNKIDKALKKIHLSADKRRGLLDTLSAYNPSRSVLKKKDFTDFTRKFKSKSFYGTRFQQVKKEIDLKEIRSRFSKRDLDKFKRAVAGEKDPHKYSGKSKSEMLNKSSTNTASRHSI